MDYGKVGAVLAGSAVAMGAFGAHRLKTLKYEPQMIQNWGTASQYLLLHGIGLVALSAHPRLASKRVSLALITSGTLLFSGSIFGLVLTQKRFLGPVTPVGGLLMIAGWAGLLI